MQYKYRPHPLEKAYALHILNAHFKLPLPPKGSNDIRLNGRDLVPFLTTSSLPRDTLRAIWSFADPEAIGVLLNIPQFCLILKCIALIQNQFLSPIDFDNGDVSGTETHVLKLTDGMDRFGKLDIALASFQALGQPPNATYLIGTYGDCGLSSSCDNNPAEGIDSNENVFQMMTNHDFQYHQWQKQQHQQHNLNGIQNGVISSNDSSLMSGNPNVDVSNATSATQIMSVSDAFGDLVQVEDKILPSHNIPEVTHAEIDADSEIIADGSVPTSNITLLGDKNVADIHPMESTKGPQEEGNSIGSTGSNDRHLFGYSGSEVVAHECTAQHDTSSIAPFESSSEKDVDGNTTDVYGLDQRQVIEEDDFGDFKEVVSQTDITEEVKDNKVVEISEEIGSVDDAFGSFEGVCADTEIDQKMKNNDHSAIIIESSVATVEPENPKMQNLGTIGTDDHGHTKIITSDIDHQSATNNIDKLSVFDSIVGELDSELPPLSAFGDAFTSSSNNIDAGIAIEMDGDEEFGEFDNASINMEDREINKHHIRPQLVSNDDQDETSDNVDKTEKVLKPVVEDLVELHVAVSSESKIGSLGVEDDGFGSFEPVGVDNLNSKTEKDNSILIDNLVDSSVPLNEELAVGAYDTEEHEFVDSKYGAITNVHLKEEEEIQICVTKDTDKCNSVRDNASETGGNCDNKEDDFGPFTNLEIADKYTEEKRLKVLTGKYPSDCKNIKNSDTGSGTQNTGGNDFGAFKSIEIISDTDAETDADVSCHNPKIEKKGTVEAPSSFRDGENKSASNPVGEAVNETSKQNDDPTDPWSLLDDLVEADLSKVGLSSMNNLQAGIEFSQQIDGNLDNVSSNDNIEISYHDVIISETTSTQTETEPVELGAPNVKVSMAVNSPGVMNPNLAITEEDDFGDFEGHKDDSSLERFQTIADDDGNVINNGKDSILQFDPISCTDTAQDKTDNEEDDLLNFSAIAPQEASVLSRGESTSNDMKLAGTDATNLINDNEDFGEFATFSDHAQDENEANNMSIDNKGEIPMNDPMSTQLEIRADNSDFAEFPSTISEGQHGVVPQSDVNGKRIAEDSNSKAFPIVDLVSDENESNDLVIDKKNDNPSSDPISTQLEIQSDQSEFAEFPSNFSEGEHGVVTEFDVNGERSVEDTNFKAFPLVDHVSDEDEDSDLAIDQKREIPTNDLISTELETQVDQSDFAEFPTNLIEGDHATVPESDINGERSAKDANSNIYPVIDQNDNSEDDFGDWSAFESTSPADLPNTSFPTDNALKFSTSSFTQDSLSLEKLRGKMVNMPSLPPELLAASSDEKSLMSRFRKRSVNIDFLYCFDNGVGTGTAADRWITVEEQIQVDPDGAFYRFQCANRFVELHEILTSSHRETPCKWIKVISAVKKEMLTGLSLVRELSNGSLSPSEISEILESGKLQIYANGLLESMRLVRLIVASIGDILCLDVSIEFNTMNLTKWENMNLLQSALEVEKHWSNICSSIKMHDLNVQIGSLMTVSEMRKMTLDMLVQATKANDTLEICNLTLQRLPNSGAKELKTSQETTASQVCWEGKTFMACAANFWSNRISIHVP